MLMLPGDAISAILADRTSIHLILLQLQMLVDEAMDLLQMHLHLAKSLERRRHALVLTYLAWVDAKYLVFLLLVSEQTV